MGVVALLATSCNKNKTQSMVYHGYSFDEQFDREYGYFDEGGRAYIDDTYRVKFEQDDQVMLYNVDSETPANSEFGMYEVEADSYQPTLVAVGTGISDLMKTAKYAFYPGENVTVDATLLGNENRSKFTLATTQEYMEGRIAPGTLYMAAKIDNEDETGNNFAFRNICGVLVMKFYTTSGKTIEKIELTDNSRNLTGDVTLKVDEVDPGRMMELFRNYPNNEAAVAEYMEQVGYAVENAGNVLTLNCDGVTLNSDDVTTFYFVLRPLALMNGFTMKLYNGDNVIKTVSTTRDNKIKPNTLRVFPALKVG